MKLFESHLVNDDRSPIYTLSVGNHQLGILAPKPQFSLQVITLLLIQMAVANVLAILCYYGIVQKKRKQQDAVTPFLVTFGIVLPLTTWAPFFLMDQLDVRSTVMRMGLVPLPICVQLKCLQAYFGYTPDAATASLRNYRCHMGFLMQPRFENGAPVAATVQSFWEALGTHTFYHIINAILYSVLAPLNFAPFATLQDAHEIFWSLDLPHLGNNFVAAVLVSLSLSFSLSGVSALIQLVGGFQCESVVDKPMFQSQSVTDFWSRRWNRLVHSGLKNGIYKPVRSFSNSRSIAAMAAFLASGVIHEYVWLILFYQNVHQDKVYVPTLGKQMLFFGWNGVLLVVEYAVGDDAWNAFFSKLPRPVVTLIVILMALPVSHLFTGDMIKGGYFTSMQLAFPMLVVTRDGST